MHASCCAGLLEYHSQACLHACLVVLLPPGIDVDGSRHVSISHADVDTADDAICIKTTTEGHPVRNVTVSDCRSGHGWVPL